ncbi:MAG TPA: hypothetical protein VIF62_16250, partial [Labilithrix sp.]
MQRGVFGFLLAGAVAIASSAAFIGTSASCGSTTSADDQSDGASGDGASDDGGRPGFPTNDDNSHDYPCDGCGPFPGLGAPECTPDQLGKSIVAYPTDGLLLPPNMNVLEVQFVPPAGATLFEVDFYNAVTKVKVETMCTPVPDVRGGASRGCGITLPQAAWNDIANINRDGDQVGVIVRATKDG